MYTHKKPKSELGFTKSTIFYIELIKDTILLNGWNNDFFLLVRLFCTDYDCCLYIFFKLIYDQCCYF